MKRIGKHRYMQIKVTGIPKYEELNDCMCKELKAENERLKKGIVYCEDCNKWIESKCWCERHKFHSQADSYCSEAVKASACLMSLISKSERGDNKPTQQQTKGERK